jgi:hypothetical protein
MLDTLCDNSLTDVISFLDFNSAVRFSKVTSKALTYRVEALNHVWKDIYRRHGFAPSINLPSDYFKECQRRRKLFLNLVGYKNRIKSCFNLPNRYYSFVPVMPPIDNDWEFVPPVDFECPSFLLPDPATSEELIFLDPFDGSLSVHFSCLEKSISSVDAMTNHKVLHVSDGIQNERNFDSEQRDEIFENCADQIPNKKTCSQGIKQVLMDINDYYKTNLSHYFFLQSEGRFDSNETLREDDEVEIEIIGIDSKPLIRDEKVFGTVVIMGRVLSTESESWSSDSKIVSEIIAWKRVERDDFNQKFVCRVRSSFKTMDFDPIHERLFFVFPINEGPFRRFDAHLLDLEDSDRLDFPGGSSIVAVYPMEPFTTLEDGMSNKPLHFPQPEFILKCEHAVCAITVCPGGKRIFTSTAKGTIEEWETAEHGSGACRISAVDVKASLIKFTTRLKLLNESAIGSTNQPVMSGVLNPTIHIIERDEEDHEGEQNNFVDIYISPIVNSFHFTTHYECEGRSFISMNHLYDQGCWLLLWTKQENTSAFEVSSTITLPISSRRKPCIHFDGRRLLVLGQDHIGVIILVYQVVSTFESIRRTPSKPYRKGDKCAGVKNISQKNRVEFVNRIRHVALGGMQHFDPAFMTVNERFIIINTKSGNLLEGAPENLNEGLLIIDLEDHSFH